MVHLLTRAAIHLVETGVASENVRIVGSAVLRAERQRTSLAKRTAFTAVLLPAWYRDVHH